MNPSSNYLGSISPTIDDGRTQRHSYWSQQQFMSTSSNPFTENDNLIARSEQNSNQRQSLALLIILPLSLVYLAACLSAIIWLAFHGPILVPNQDTRLTSIVISASSRLATIIMGLVFVRSAWASAVHDMVDGRPMTAQRLIVTCKPFLSLGQLEHYRALPTSFKFHIFLGAVSLSAMVATSSSFRYDPLPITGRMMAQLPDVAFACPAKLVEETGLFICDRGGQKLNILTNTSIHSWDYFAEVKSGGQQTVTKHGEIGDTWLGANVTLAALPPGWKLDKAGNNLPWMAMSVSCRDVPISVSSTGSGYEANTSVYLNGYLADYFDIGKMPQWNAGVHLLPRVNETGPFSSLGEYDVVMLGRDIEPNMRGIDPATLTPLGSAYMDLNGYGAILQPLTGAGAHCQFRASTGGHWQTSPLWPPLNHTTNTVWGELVDGDRPTLATAMLNYGASWQYTQVSDNDIPGGSVSYIANNTRGSDGVTFSQLMASYIRNQWALMAYAIPRHTFYTLQEPFHGTGPEKLFISVTLVALAPCIALVISILATVRALFSMASSAGRYWANRVEFESWWLFKACRPDLYPPGFENATEDAFLSACKEISAEYHHQDAVVHVFGSDGRAHMLRRPVLQRAVAGR